MKPGSSVAGNEATALGRSNIKRQERTAAPAISIQRIHLAFKTHLDVGYTDLAREVAKRYFELYVPQAIHLAQTLRQAGGEKRFVWTTGSWLIYEYLERASRSDRARMEQAILDGDIVWHGLPFTVFSELMDADLFRFGLSLSQELDRRFGKRTIAAKMTDVPGHTRSIVPLLAEAGIQFLHIGVNAGSTPPAVPPVFVWRDPSGAQVIVMLHKGGYCVSSWPKSPGAIGRPRRTPWGCFVTRPFPSPTMNGSMTSTLSTKPRQNVGQCPTLPSPGWQLREPSIVSGCQS